MTAVSLPQAAPASLPLVPAPRSVTQCAGSLTLDATTEIVIDDDPAARAVATSLARWIDVPGSRVRVIPRGAPGPAHAIILRLETPSGPATRDPAVAPPADLDDESYSLGVTATEAVVRAKHPAGLFYGAQTLAQLASSRPLLPPPPTILATRTERPGGGGVPSEVAPPAIADLLAAPPRTSRVLPCVAIEDAPAFRFRAVHLDVARHFFPLEVVERYVDLLSFYRFNVFHWHLTDDQGFRLDIRSHPELVSVGATRLEDGQPYAGHYTQADARAVVAFAKERFVTVVPEIEMPGHARAILAAHPELSCSGKKQEVPTTWGIFDDVLCAGNEGTFTLLGDILRETTEVFPSQLVHVGGDEVPKRRWNECPKCRARMQHEHVDAAGLQGLFTKRIGDMLAARGRRMMAWDEVLDASARGGGANDAVVVAWQGEGRGALAARQGHDVVMAPLQTSYFNFWQSRSRTEPGHSGHVPWTRVLASTPLPPGLEPAAAAHVIGSEAALWTEHVRTASELDTLLLPRLGALAETLWRAGASTDAAALETSFIARFALQRRQLDASGVRYFVEPPLGLRPHHAFVGQTELRLSRPALHPDGVVRFTLDGSDPTATSSVHDAPVVLHAATTVAARLFLPGGRASETVRGVFEPAALHAPVAAAPAGLRPGVLYRYFELPGLHAVPDVARGAPTRRGRLEALSFDSTFRDKDFAVLYDAFFEVADEGVYRFETRSDDGVLVDIDGVRVVSDDGDHAARTADGEIALARGLHAVKVSYFQGGGGRALDLACEGPGHPVGPCPLLAP
ncbi:MAG: Beta-hexosaminidase [Labilithrix sp.]|nr:Beta-hexosaminidase [Labilithrix sp.]